MRDLNRIPEVLSAVEKLWRKYPGLSFGQMISCVEAYLLETRDIEDIFWMEDEDFIKVFEEMMEEQL